MVGNPDLESAWVWAAGIGSGRLVMARYSTRFGRFVRSNPQGWDDSGGDLSRLVTMKSTHKQFDFDTIAVSLWK